MLTIENMKGRGLFGFVWAMALTAFALGLTGCETAGAAPQSSAEWNVMAVDKLEWVGIEKDRERLPQRTPEVLSFGGSFVVEGEDGTSYVIYWPTKDGLTEYRDTALMLASFDPEKGPQSISRKRIETGVFLGEKRAQGYVSGIPMQTVEGEKGLEIWYFHPYERRLVQYRVANGERKSWDFTEILPMYNISWTWGSHWLDFYLEPGESTVRFSIYRQEGVHFATYDLETKEWSEEKLEMRSSPWIMPTKEGLWLTTLAEERLFRYARDPQAGEWSRMALTPVPIRRGEVLMFLDNEERLNMLLWDYGYSLQLTQPDGELWKVEYVKTVPKEKARAAGKSEVFFAVSAAYGPDGTLHLCWFDPLEGKLQHLWRANGTWYEEDITSPGQVYSTSMVHTGERLLISYVDMADESVYVASRKAGAMEGGEKFEVPPPLHYMPMGGKDVSWLHLVSSRGDTERMKELLKKGAHINGADSRGASPLHYAVLGGAEEAVRLLLDRDAFVNATDKSGRTPLHAAAFANSPEILEMLVAAGASVGTSDDAGSTPLHLAVRQGNVEAARVLLDKGARADAKDKQGRTPLSIARDSENQELINLLTGL